MIKVSAEHSKAPRWINTEAGEWAWFKDEQWRISADSAFSVQDRRNLLQAAEEKWRSREQVTA